LRKLKLSLERKSDWILSVFLCLFFDGNPPILWYAKWILEVLLPAGWEYACLWVIWECIRPRVWTLGGMGTVNLATCCRSCEVGIHISLCVRMWMRLLLFVVIHT
jgi:hypothetical protein